MSTEIIRPGYIVKKYGRYLIHDDVYHSITSTFIYGYWLRHIEFTNAYIINITYAISRQYFKTNTAPPAFDPTEILKWLQQNIASIPDIRIQPSQICILLNKNDYSNETSVRE